jgi:hypothetical protein
MSVHGHPTEKCSKKVIELLEFIILLGIGIALPVLRTRVIFLRSIPIIVRLLLRIYERGVGIGYFLEDFLGPCIDGSLPSY